MKRITIGQRVLAAILSHQLGITMDRALKHYVRGRGIDPAWEDIGEKLLTAALAARSEEKVTDTEPHRAGYVN